MSSIQIRDVDPELIERLKAVAQRERRSLAQQVLHILDRYLEEREGAQRRGMAEAAERLRAYWSTVEPVSASDLEPADRTDEDRARRIQDILDGAP